MINKTRLLTPGPTPLPEVVKLAMARDMIHHRKDEFKALMQNVQHKLQLLFGCATPVLPMACTGTGVMTAAVYSLFMPGDHVLVVEAGKFGQRWSEIAHSRGLEVTRLAVEWGHVVRPEQILSHLRPETKGILVQQCETSTGVLQPLDQISAVLRGHDALLVVDGISGVGISPCPMDEWGIDCLLTGSQKGLMVPPGLGLLALSPRAWQVAQGNAPGCFYFNLPRERAMAEKGQTLFTSAISLIVGLDASLDLLFQKGLDVLYKKQWAMTMLVRHGAKAMGLNLFAPENFAWGITSICLPDGINGQAILEIMRKKYGVVMAGGQDDLKGRIVRLGHMGWVDWGDCLSGLVALEKALDDAGAQLTKTGYLEKAMHAYACALEGTPGEIPPGLD